MPGKVALAALAILVALAALAPTARAQTSGRGPKNASKDPLAALAEETGTPLQVLRDAHAERVLSADANERRKFLKEIAQAPRGELLGLVAWMAENDKDPKTEIAALACVSCFALLADRDEVLRLCLPLAEHGIEKGQQFARHGIEELVRLNRWFRWDKDIAPFLTTVFRGEDFNLRSFAFDGIRQLRNPGLVETLVKPACWEVYRSKRVSLFDRRDAIRTLVDLADRSVIPEMQKNLRGDGHVAIVSAWGLVELLDPSSLVELRKLDMTAVHALRKPAWIARCLLDDPSCLDEVQRTAENRNEHPEIKRSFVAALGEMPSREKAQALLERLWAADMGDAVHEGAALGLLRLGDARGVDLLVKKLLGPWPDDQSLRFQGHGWMRQLRFMDDVLRIRNKQVGPLLVAMTEVKVPDHKDRYDKDGKEKWIEWWRHGTRRENTLPEWYDEYQGDAVSLCGELGLQDTLPRLRELSAFGEKISHLKFHALVSRWELGDAKALRELERFLPYYDDSIMKDVWVTAGQVEIRTERLQWSTIFDVCAKARRMRDGKYLELLELLLKTKSSAADPMAQGWAKKLEGGAPADGGTVARGEKSPLEKPPEVEYLCRNQFVRRAIALAAGEIGGEKAAPQLARALRDARAVVRAAALEEIGRISGRYTLAIGATAAEEHAVFSQAVAWLKEKGAWPD